MDDNIAKRQGTRIMEFLCAAIIAIALFAFTGCGGSKSSVLPATQNAPTFSTAAANDFVRDLSQTANDYAAALKAKNVAKIAALTPKLDKIMSTRQTAAGSLNPGEAKKLRDWSNTLMQQVMEAVKGAANVGRAKTIDIPSKKSPKKP